MGGIGSGRYPRIGSRGRRPFADRQVLRLDVRELYKAGVLWGDARGSVTWQRGETYLASIDIRSLTSEPALRLDYNFGPHQIPVRETVRLAFTACHFGGDRLVPMPLLRPPLRHPLGTGPLPVQILPPRRLPEPE